MSPTFKKVVLAAFCAVFWLAGIPQDHSRNLPTPLPFVQLLSSRENDLGARPSANVGDSLPALTSPTRTRSV
jgi:hypothetical protein